MALRRAPGIAAAILAVLLAGASATERRHRHLSAAEIAHNLALDKQLEENAKAVQEAETRKQEGEDAQAESPDKDSEAKAQQAAKYLSMHGYGQFGASSLQQVSVERAARAALADKLVEHDKDLKAQAVLTIEDLDREEKESEARTKALAERTKAFFRSHEKKKAALAASLAGGMSRLRALLPPEAAATKTRRVALARAKATPVQSAAASAPKATHNAPLTHEELERTERAIAKANEKEGEADNLLKETQAEMKSLTAP